MRRTKLVRAIGSLSAIALIAAACGDGDVAEDPASPDEAPSDEEEEEEPADEEPAASGGELSTYIGEPESLITLNTTESEGIAVLRSLYTPLITYDLETNAPAQGVAESIVSEDAGLTWTITLQEGWTFHNGEPITADSFINAWNYGANPANAMQNAGFFASIEGYGEESEELSGLEKIDELTFEVTLQQPEAFFETRLGYPAYAPLPEAFYEDPAAFNEAPIGNGPFMMDGEWGHDQQIRTVRYDDYPLEQAKVDALEFRIYADVNTAVNDLLAGNLDIVDLVPPERFGEVQQQLGEELTGQTASSSITYLGVPWYDEQLGGEENQKLRQALSQAIDREAINDSIFAGFRQPATNLLTPVIPGYEEEVCENWTHDPEAARQAYEESGGFEGTMTVWFNAGGGHDQWVEAVTNQWREVLGIEDFTFEQLQFADYLEVLDEQGATGPFRLGWGMDYPHPQNYLQLLLDGRFHSDSGGANSSFYENPEYDALIDEALSFAELDDALPIWQDAAEVACEDVPVIPIYYGTNTFAHGETVQGLTVDAFGDINYTGVSVSE